MSKILVNPFHHQNKRSPERLDQFVLGLRELQTETKTQGYYDRLQRASSWLAKASRTDRDPEARFIFLWVALDALCAIRNEVIKTPWWTKEKEGHPVLSNREPDKDSTYQLEWFLWRISGLDVGERALTKVIKDKWDDVTKLFGTRYLMPTYWTWKLRTDEEIEQRNKSSLRTVEKAITSLTDRKKMYRALQEIIIWRLRILRNQLVHGCATDTHSKRRAAGESELEIGSRLLEELVWAFLALMTSQAGQARYWPPSPYPRACSAQHQPFDTSWLPHQ